MSDIYYNSYMKCPICLEIINNPQQQYKTICNHYFCKECLNKWNNSNQQNYNLCPICRQEINTIINIPLSNENMNHNEQSNIIFYTTNLLMKLICSIVFIFLSIGFILLIFTL